MTRPTRHIGGSILPSNDRFVLQPKEGVFGRFETRVLEKEDTHVLLFFPKGIDTPVTVAKNSNGYSCDELAKRVIKAWETRGQADIAAAFAQRDFMCRGNRGMSLEAFYHFVMSGDLDSGR